MAYDVQKLLAEYKKHGLDLAEDAAKAVVVSSLDWFVAEAAASESKIDDMVAGVLVASKPAILAGLDMIDGEVG